jgi:hypothetical protein
VEEVLESRPPASPVCRIEAGFGYLPISPINRGNEPLPRRGIRGAVAGEGQVGQEAAKVRMEGGTVTD